MARVVMFVGIALVWGSRTAAADGALDPTFGNGGLVIQDFAGGDDILGGMAIQDDGRIIGLDSTRLARFRTDGSLDPTFGDGGIAATPVKAGFNEVAIQRDGKIVIVGTSVSVCVIVRYNPDGSLDPSFGTGGMTSIGFGDDEFRRAVGVAVRDDGKIVIEGAVVRLSTFQTGFVTMRVARDGSLDPSFNGTGIAVAPLSGSGFPSGLALQANDKIVVVGSELDQHVVIRYNDDGSLDSSFNGAGIVVGSVPSPGGPQTATGVAIQLDGSILITVGGGSIPTFTIARYRPDGSLDASFGTGGVKTGENGTSFAIALQSDGRILVAGVFVDKAGTGFALARFNSDGSEDVTFGGGGAAEVRFSRPAFVEMRRTPLQVQSDGRIVVGATLGRLLVGAPPTHDGVLARFE